MTSRWRRRNRWSDNDRNFGPFTYARDGRGYRPFAIVLQSKGDDPDESGDCNLRLSGFGHTLIMTLPPVVRLWRRWVDTSRLQTFSSRDGSPEPLRPGSGYWDMHPREYGFSLNGSGATGESTFLQVFLGAQTMDSSTTQSWSKFLPWTEWRHVRRSLYGLAGEHIWTEPTRKRGEPWNFDTIREAEAACPSRRFSFSDFDGEKLIATTRIEEREWRFGEGWFRWLSLFRRPLIRRSLSIEFSGETGERKGSWKGGTLGTGIDVTATELHESAFRRYCAKNKMTFIGDAA